MFALSTCSFERGSGIYVGKHIEILAILKLLKGWNFIMEALVN